MQYGVWPGRYRTTTLFSAKRVKKKQKEDKDSEIVSRKQYISWRTTIHLWKQKIKGSYYPVKFLADETSYQNNFTTYFAVLFIFS